MWIRGRGLRLAQRHRGVGGGGTSPPCAEGRVNIPSYILIFLCVPRIPWLVILFIMGNEPRNTRKAQKTRTQPRNSNCPHCFLPAQAGFLLLFRKKMQISPKSSKNMYEQTVNTPLTPKPKSWPVSSLFQTSVDSQ